MTELPPLDDDHADTRAEPADAADAAELAELRRDGHTRAELRRARREFLLEAAIEAERDTGRREQTDDEAKHSLWLRLARLVGGWVLVLLGLAAIPLPGPGWLMVLLGLTLLPYRWTDNLIREIRRRIPGIPEDGRIPTRTWAITGLMVALATVASVWWGLRDQGNDDAKADPTEQASGDRSGATAKDPVVYAPTGTAGNDQVTLLYATVIAEVDGARATAGTPGDACLDLSSGRVDVIVPTLAEATTCFGGADPAAIRVAADAVGAKVFAPVQIGDVTYLPIARHDRVAIDDEPTELAIDGVSELLGSGADPAGDQPEHARSLMREAGVLK